MSLADCIKKHDLEGCVISEGYVVYPGCGDFPTDLWGCTDYKVSSRSGGCVWLIKVAP